MDINGKLAHFGIKLPESVDEAEVTAAKLLRAEAYYARERRDYNRLPKEERGAAAMFIKLNRRTTTCATSGRQRRSAAASVGIRTLSAMTSATIWAESMA